MATQHGAAPAASSLPFPPFEWLSLGKKQTQRPMLSDSHGFQSPMEIADSWEDSDLTLPQDPSEGACQLPADSLDEADMTQPLGDRKSFSVPVFTKQAGQSSQLPAAGKRTTVSAKQLEGLLERLGVVAGDPNAGSHVLTQSEMDEIARKTQYMCQAEAEAHVSSAVLVAHTPRRTKTGRSCSQEFQRPSAAAWQAAVAERTDRKRVMDTVKEALMSDGPPFIAVRFLRNVAPHEVGIPYGITEMCKSGRAVRLTTGRGCSFDEAGKVWELCELPEAQAGGSPTHHTKRTYLTGDNHDDLRARTRPHKPR
jgi:hypothetical protein